MTWGAWDPKMRGNGRERSSSWGGGREGGCPLESSASGLFFRPAFTIEDTTMMGGRVACDISLGVLRFPA